MAAICPDCCLPSRLPGAADFQIGRCDAEARTQLGELLNGRQALLRVVGQRPFIGDQKVGIGLVAASSDAAAQLVQLREAERVGPIDEDGVGVGHIDAGLDDGGGNQHIRLAAEKFQHHGFQRFGIHLSMRHDHARFGNELMQPGPGPLHRLHPIMDKVDLAASSELPEDGFSNQLVVGADDLCANGQAAGRGRVDDREIPHARHGHLQGAGNRRGGERQDVDLRAQLFQPFLVFDAEPLFLIDDHQTEIAETSHPSAGAGACRSRRRRCRPPRL